MSLIIRNVCKNYGKIKALENVSLELKPGVYGLLGPNGAGKSTLLQVITGNLRTSKGEILYNGSDINKNAKNYKRVLGYVPQSQGIYERFTAEMFLEYMAILKAVDKKNIHTQVERVLDVVGLKGVKDRKIGGFSGGMQQRLLIAQALLGNPEIIVFDEPTAGLDPKERIKIRNFISRIAEDKIILVATHVVSDVETIAKEIILLGKGKIIAQGMPSELCMGLNGHVWECQVHAGLYELIDRNFMISNLQEKSGGILR